MSACNQLQLLKSGFNALAQVCQQTEAATYLRHDVAGAEQYQQGLHYAVSQSVRASADALGDFARNEEQPVSLRRSATAFLLEAGLEPQHVPLSVKTCTFYVLQRVYDAQALVPFAPDVAGRVAALQFPGNHSSVQILQRQQARLVASLTGKPQPVYAHGVRASQP